MIVNKTKQPPNTADHLMVFSHCVPCSHLRNTMATEGNCQSPSEQCERLLQSPASKASPNDSQQGREATLNTQSPSLSRPVGRLSFLKITFSTFTLHSFEAVVGQKQQGVEICVWPINIEVGHYSQCPTCHGFM